LGNNYIIYTSKYQLELTAVLNMGISQMYEILHCVVIIICWCV